MEPDQAPISDDLALSWLRSHDADGIRRLVAAWSGGMLRLARVHVASAAAAEDVVQDAWLIILEGVARYEGRGSLRSYAFGVVANLARRAGSKERRTIPFSGAWREARLELQGPAVPPDRFDREGRWLLPPRAWQLGVEDVLEAEALRRRLEAAIDQLPVRQRAVMTAADVLGFDNREVCELFGLTAGNQRVLLHRARAGVRSMLEGAPDRSQGSDRSQGDAVSAPPGEHRHSGRAPRRPRRGDLLVCRQLVELVDDYLDGSLDADLRGRVESHLAGCGHCGEYVSQVRTLLHVTACLSAAAPPPLMARLTTALLSRANTGPPPSDDPPGR